MLTSKFGIRQTLTIRTHVLRCCAALLLLGVPPAWAQCGLDNSSYLFLHPFFSAKRWNYSLQSIGVDLAPELCENFSPLSVSFAGSADKASAIMSTAGGVYLVNITSINEQCQCCRYTLLFGAPESLGLAAGTYTPGGPSYLWKSASIDTLVAITARQGGALSFMRIRRDVGSVLSVDNVALTSRPYAQSIRYLGGDLNAAGTMDQGIWITGTRGLLRYIPITNGARGSESVFDIDTSETVLCVGGGYVGTFSGRIYRRNGNNFVLHAQPVTTPIRGIDSLTAVGDNGTILVRSAMGWSSFRQGNGSLRFFNRIFGPEGRSVEVLSSTWGYDILAYADSASSIRSVTPSTLMPFVNGQVFRFNDQPIDVRITIRDVDSNYQAPSVLISSGASRTSLNVAGAVRLGNAAPGALCEAGKVVFADTSILVRVSPLEVTYQAQSKRGTLNVFCNSCAWAPYLFSNTQPWRFGDTLTISVGTSVLRLLHTASSTIAGQTLSSGIQNARLLINGRRLDLAGTSPIRSVSLYDVAGRRVAVAIAPSSSSVVSLSGPVPNGLALVRVEYGDGTSRILKVGLSR